MSISRAGAIALLALFLASCGDGGSGSAPSLPAAGPTRLAVLPPASASSGPDAPVATPAFPGAPIYDFVFPAAAAYSPTTGSFQAEEHVAISPLNGGCTWMATISDFSIRPSPKGNFNTTKYAITYDFAATWHEMFVPISGQNAGDQVQTADNQSWDANSDPVVAFDGKISANHPLGNVYLVSLYFNDTTNANPNVNGIYVAVAPVGSNTTPLNFARANVLPVVTNLDPATTNSEDKEWMAVDNSTGSSLFKGRVYVCWSRFIGNAANIMLTWSDDPTTEPLTGWKTTPIQLNPNSQTGFVQGSQVAVGPDGTVYVVYDVSVTGGHETFFTKSTDGGVHWSDGVKPPALPPVARSMQTAPFAPIGFKASYRYDSFPYLAVNPVNGDIYVVYPDQPPTTNSAIEFIRSADGGAHFSTPFVLNDVTMTGERLMPSITADVRNNIHVSWFDTRNGANAQTYDIYAARGSLASGTLTWSTSNLRVTPSSVAVSKFNNFIGDYAGIASSEINDGGTLWGFAVPVWSGKNPGTQILQARLLAYTTP